MASRMIMIYRKQFHLQHRTSQKTVAWMKNKIHHYLKAHVVKNATASCKNFITQTYKLRTFRALILSRRRKRKSRTYSQLIRGLKTLKRVQLMRYRKERLLMSLRLPPTKMKIPVKFSCEGRMPQSGGY